MTKTSNSGIFRALKSETRRKIYGMLLDEELHISAISRKIGLSVPVIARHVKILEEAGLVDRRIVGRTHLLKGKRERIYEVMDETASTSTIQLESGSTILDALKGISAVGIRRVNEKEYVVSIDGEEGYYLYEVNGRLLDIPMDECSLQSDAEVKLKKLLPITQKIIRIRLNR